MVLEEDEFDEKRSTVDDDEPDTSESEVVEVGIFDAPRKWQFGDFAFIASAFVFNLSSALTHFVGQATDQIGAHRAYRDTHVDFADEVMRDIRKL